MWHDVGMEPNNWERLGEAIRARRAQLGLTQQDVSRSGGPSDFTLSAIEQGTPRTYHQRTKMALERVLRWKSGAVESILAGEDPAGWELPGTPVAEKPAVPTTSARDRAVAALLDYAGTLDNPSEVLTFVRRLMEPKVDA